MMFKEKMVAVVKCDGKIMRENGEEVQLPFGKEYSILIKNLQSKKAKVNISIDGEDVLNGHSLLINGNSEIELERFIKDLDEGCRFKFIQKTQKIQEHRGDKIDDGIIRIEFKYEKDKQEYHPININNWNDVLYNSPTSTWDYNHYDIRCGCSFENPINTTSVSLDNLTNTLLTNSIDSNLIGDTKSIRDFTNSVNYTTNLTNTINDLNSPRNDEGITTKGSKSNQQFKYGSISELEENSYVITFQLKGYTESGKIISEPITVKTPIICNICGTNNKSTHKYCKECGTYLE